MIYRELQYLFQSTVFSDSNILQGSVATRLKCGIFSHHFTANLSLSLTVNKFWKSVKIWQWVWWSTFLEHSLCVA